MGDGVLRRLFRPSYGERIVVTPRRWWSPAARRDARLAAVIAEYQAIDTVQLTSDMVIYGFAMTDSSGRRIPPLSSKGWS